QHCSTCTTGNGSRGVNMPACNPDCSVFHAGLSPSFALYPFRSDASHKARSTALRSIHPALTISPICSAAVVSAALRPLVVADNLTTSSASAFSAYWRSRSVTAGRADTAIGVSGTVEGWWTLRNGTSAAGRAGIVSNDPQIILYPGAPGAITYPAALRTSIPDGSE